MKKEHTTSLRGSQMVRKDHPEICFRGLLDDAIAGVCFGAALAHAEGKQNLECGLKDITCALMNIMGAHVCEKEPQPWSMLGRDMETLHEMSHNPTKYFSTTQFLPKPEQGPALAWLNVIRTQVRDAECALIACYEDTDPPEGICRSLNRVSSAVFVLMCEENSQFVY